MPLPPAALRKHPFFDGLDDEKLASLAEIAGEAAYAPSSFVLRRGDFANAFFLVRTGKVALELHLPGRDKVVLDTVGPGGVLGFAWYQAPFRWSVDARVVEPADVLVLDADGLRGKMHADPALGFAILHRLFGHLHERLHRDREQRATRLREREPAARPAHRVRRPQAISRAIRVAPRLLDLSAWRRRSARS